MGVRVIHAHTHLKKKKNTRYKTHTKAMAYSIRCVKTEFGTESTTRNKERKKK